MISRLSGTLVVLLGTLLAGFMLAGCPSSQAVTRATDSSEMIDTTVYHEGFPWGIRPGSCRLVATLIRTEKGGVPSGPNDPCRSHPCRAWVTVDSVLGCGEGVSEPMQVGDTVLFSFPMTLDDTRDLALGIREVYPGLVPSDRFGADVLYLASPGSASSRTDGSLTVYAYARRTVRSGGMQ